MTQFNVEKAVILTPSGTLPFANAVMKLEMLPPGQDATKIIPIATDSERKGRRAIHNKNVTKGSKKICEKTPTKKLFGLCTTVLNSDKLICKAIPNITNARITFITVNEPGLKFNVM